MSTMSQWDPGSYGRVNTLQQYVAEQALAGLTLTGDERVLDVGCGDGRVTELVTAQLTGGSLLGVDPSEAMVAAARQRFAGRADVEFSVGTAATLAYQHEFDLVTSFNALHWETRWALALEHMRIALKPQARAFLVFVCGGPRPSLENVFTNATRTERWRNWFDDFAAPFVHVDPDDYAAAAKTAGFSVDHIEAVDLEWDFGDRASFAAWATAGTPAWTSRLPLEERSAFVDEALTAYAQVSGSASVLRFLQCRVGLTAADVIG